MKVVDVFHDLWCAITHKCRVKIEDDSYLQWLKFQERASLDAIEESHRQRDTRDFSDTLGVHPVWRRRDEEQDAV